MKDFREILVFNLQPYSELCNETIRRKVPKIRIKITRLFYVNY